MAGAEQTTYPRMTTIVCLTDLIFALDMPSNECALGLKDRKDYLLRQSRLLKSYHNTEGVCEHKGFLLADRHSGKKRPTLEQANDYLLRHF